MFIAGCASNQAIKTTDGKTIVTDGKPQVDKKGYSIEMQKRAKRNKSIETKLQT